MRCRLLTAVLAVLALGTPALACEGRRVDGPFVQPAPVCAPERPLRVATLDPFFSLQMALWLDAPVIASARSGASLPDLEPPLAERLAALAPADLGAHLSPDIEALLEVEPDLILGDAHAHAGLHETLSRIAPTVLVDAADWRDWLRTLAEALGRRGAADAALSAYAARAAEVAALVPEGATASFLRIVPGGFQVYVDGPAAYAPARVLADAGFARPPFETATDDTVLRRPGWEGLLLLEGDVMFYTFGGGHHASEGRELEQETLAHPLWSAIPAVRAERAMRVDPGLWMGFGGPHSAMRMLDDIERAARGLSR
ncbi:MAG: ABC transporter substrate-binding protein [Pseudomonadota bacterium]